jgi:hypothetical protein
LTILKILIPIYVVFNTKVSNKNPRHIFKYKRCKTCPIEIKVKNELIRYYIYLV